MNINFLEHSIGKPIRHETRPKRPTSDVQLIIRPHPIYLLLIKFLPYFVLINSLLQKNLIL